MLSFSARTDLFSQLPGPVWWIWALGGVAVGVGLMALGWLLTGRRLLSLQAEIARRERVEGELRERERQLNLAQRLAQIGSWRWDSVTNTMVGSDEFFRIFGVERSEQADWTPEKSWARIHPEDRERVRQAWLDLAFKGVSQTSDYRIVLPNGTVRTVLFEADVITEAGPNGPQPIGVIHDISERKQYERALHESEERYRAFFSQSLEGLVRIEFNRPIMTTRPLESQVELLVSGSYVAECNDSFARMYGYESGAEVVGLRLDELSPMNPFVDANWSHSFIEAGYRFSGESQELDRHRKERFFLRTVTGIRVDDSLVRLWSTQLDIADRKRYERHLEQMANFDSLTGLPNRFLFEDRMKQGLALAQRKAERLAVHYLDLDRFKNVNDTLGHRFGDELLRSVALRLASAVREVDTVARLGGDEFAIIQTGVTGLGGVAALAEKVLEQLAQPFDIDGHRIHTGATIGIATSAAALSAGEIMAQADTALNRCKEQRPGGFQFHSEQLALEVRRYVRLSEDLHGAAERGEFLLEFQPQVCLDSEQLVGVEALLRWNHPERGLLGPGRFIEVLERSGQIVPIGAWVLEEACRRRQAWLAHGIKGFPVAVNLSGIQLKEPLFGSRIREIIDAVGLAPELLELELTETTLMEGSHFVANEFGILQGLGVSFCIDDFGTGYSSLQSVRALPVTRIKIAREFVSGVPEVQDDLAIVEAIVSLAQKLGLEVLAEGVETAEQRDFLRRIGCDHAQGHFFGAAMPESEFLAWVESRRVRPS